MKALLRTGLPKWSQKKIDELLSLHKEAILKHSSPSKIIVFGSAVTGLFDACSDLDFVAVYSSKTEAKQSAKNLYSNKPIPAFPVDYICVDEETFQRKSELGGIFFVARNEGRVLFEERDTSKQTDLSSLKKPS